MRFFAISLFLVIGLTPFFGEGIILKDGTILQGKIVSTNSTEVILESKIGTIKIAPYQIKEMVWDVSKSAEIAKLDFILTTNAIYTFILKGQILAQFEILNLQRYSIKLPENEKQAIFNHFEMKDWLGNSALNLIPVFSIGTWAIGEWKTALVTSSGMLLFGALALSIESSSSDAKILFGILAGGLYLYNLAYPAIYQWFYNEQIKTVLSMNPERLDPSLKSQSMFPKLGFDGIALHENTMIFEIPVFSASF